MPRRLLTQDPVDGERRRRAKAGQLPAPMRLRLVKVLLLQPGDIQPQSFLVRTESNIEITTSTSLLTFAWITRDVQVDIVDQNAVELPGSRFSGRPSP